MPFPSRAEYEELIYSVPQQFADEIVTSTLRLYSTSPATARVEGEVHFANGLRLRVREFIDFRQERILDYGYTVFRSEERIRWYDPHSHPELRELASTFPHHRHELPDPSAGSGQSIKQNRRPAPGISFQAPNIPTLIADCLELGRALETET